MSVVALERRRDGHGRRYSLEAELLFPDVVGGRILGMVEQKGALWSSALGFQYGLGGECQRNLLTTWVLLSVDSLLYTISSSLFPW